MSDKPSKPEKPKKRVRTARCAKSESDHINKSDANSYSYSKLCTNIGNYLFKNLDDVTLDDIIKVKGDLCTLSEKLNSDMHYIVIKKYFTNADDIIVQEYNDIINKRRRESPALIHESPTPDFESPTKILDS